MLRNMSSIPSQRKIGAERGSAVEFTAMVGAIPTAQSDLGPLVYVHRDCAPSLQPIRYRFCEEPARRGSVVGVPVL